MVKPFERPTLLSGEWYLPGQPSHRVPGNLDLSNRRRPTLRLIGDFRDRPFRSVAPNPICILGETVGSRRVTLLNCQLVSWHRTNFGSSRVSTAEFQAEVALADLHCTDLDTPTTRVSFQYNVLASWVGKSGIKPSDDPFFRPRYVYRPPKDMSLFENQDCSAHVGFRITGQASATAPPISHEPALVMEFSKSRPFREALLLARKARHLLMMAVASQLVEVTEISGDFEQNAHPNKKYPFHVMGCGLFASTPIEEFPDDSEKYLFRLNDIRTGQFLRNWFEKESLEPIVDLYASAAHNSGMSIDDRFMSIVAALEGLHRRTRRGFERPKQAHRARLKKMLDSAPPAHRAWLKGKLNFSNEKTLRQRLTELVGSVTSIIDEVMDSDLEISTVLQRAVRSRNYFAHYDPAAVPPRSVDLVNATRVLTQVLEISLLREFGMTKPKVAKLVQFHRDQRPYRFTAVTDIEYS